MNITRTRIVRTLAIALGIGLASTAMAQSTWSLKTTGSGGSCTLNGANSSTYGNSYGCSGSVVGGGTAAGSSVNVSAWSADRGTGTGQVITGSGSNWANSFISNQGSSGFGAASRTEGIGVSSPDHAFDSIPPGSFDMALLSFNSSIVLSHFGIGWAGGDSDMLVMRWAGNGSPVLANAGTTSVGSKDMLNSTIGGGGWEFVTAQTNANTTTQYATGADLSKGSSFWLVAAFNTTMAPHLTGISTGNDAFKLNFLKTANYTCPGGGSQNPGGGCGPGNTTPEPGSLALAGLAALGAFGVRRRRVKPIA